MDINQLIADHGQWFYPITVVWTFLEGETFVIFAGAASFHGLLNLPLLIASAWLGSFAGDQFYFYLGRVYGQKILARFPKWRAGVDIALGLLHKYHVGFILSFRFIYGVRNFSSFAMGLSELSWPRFLALNFIAAGLWAATFGIAGYLLGKAFEAVLGNIARDFGLVMLAVFLIVASGLLMAYKRRIREIERKAVLGNGGEPPPAAAAAEAIPAELPPKRSSAGG